MRSSVGFNVQKEEFGKESKFNDNLQRCNQFRTCLSIVNEKLISMEMTGRFIFNRIENR